ncbi:hypothetical protein M885DRAFT_557640 [Pelagophyceae sp. CCMP2097]|nr:hypothetical protein M885DRAFT_557640 [Pelagophyceae sp. CCMP2097]
MDVDWHILFFNAFPKSDSSPSVKSVGQTSPACVADASLFDTTLRHRHAAKRAFDAIGAPRALSGARVHVSNHHAEPDAAAAEPTRASAPFDDEPGGYGYFVFLDDEAPSGRGPKPASVCGDERRLLGPKNADQPQSKKRQKTPTPAVGLPSLRPIG